MLQDHLQIISLKQTVEETYKEEDAFMLKSIWNQKKNLILTVTVE